MGVSLIPNRGVAVQLSEYTPLKAFQGGGYFWDTQPQQIIRDVLGDILPSVQRKSEDGQSLAVFSHVVGKKEMLSRTRPLGQSKIPKKQLQRLDVLVARLRAKVDSDETQLTAKELIPKFRLPDPSHDPDLYRVSGFWWNRRLYILWGCERRLDSSLEPSTAIAKLPSDDFHMMKQVLALICLLVLLLLVPWLIGPPIKAYTRRLMNKAPVAALRLDSTDQTNRTAVVSDAGSRDLDGEIVKWGIDWGDGTTNVSAKAPIGLHKKYDRDGDYQISLTCFDNLGATSRPPATLKLKLDYDQVVSENVRKAEAEAESLRQARILAQAEAKKNEDSKLKAEAEAQSLEAARLRSQASAKSEKENRLKAEADAALQEELRRTSEAKAKAAEEANLRANAEQRQVPKEQRNADPAANPVRDQQGQPPRVVNAGNDQPPPVESGNNPASPTAIQKQEEPDKGGPKLQRGFPQKRKADAGEAPQVLSNSPLNEEIRIRAVGKGRLEQDGNVEISLAATEANKREELLAGREMGD